MVLLILFRNLRLYCSDTVMIFRYFTIIFRYFEVYYSDKADIIPLKRYNRRSDWRWWLIYITVKEAAEKWGISDRRIRVLCSEGKIPGAYQEGRGWKIPIDAEKPADGRFKSKESILSQINRKKQELDGRRPLWRLSCSSRSWISSIRWNISAMTVELIELMCFYR